MTIDDATARDLDEILALVRELADYEREPDAVVFDREEFARHLFGPDAVARALVARNDDAAVAGMALYYRTFSTWLGRDGIWLEDLFVRPAFRRNGYARAAGRVAGTLRWPGRMVRAGLERARAGVLPHAGCGAGRRLDDLAVAAGSFGTMTDRSARFPPLAPERAATWSRFGKWDTVWYPQFLGIQVEELRQDYARMRLAYRPEFRQPAGVVHGGVIASLIDTVVVPAVGSGYDEPRQLFTIDLQLRFLAPIVDDDLVAEGWVSQRGRQIVFCDAEVRSGAGVLAATATLTYKVSSRPQTF